MIFKIEVTSYFRKQAKPLLKKYPSLKLELDELFKLLMDKPTTGVTLGNHCFKIRIAIGSKGKGKSGGARIITHIQVHQSKVYMLSIYDKSEQKTLVDKELQMLLKLIP